jgi:hypothetical protein
MVAIGGVLISPSSAFLAKIVHLGWYRAMSATTFASKHPNSGMLAEFQCPKCSSYEPFEIIQRTLIQVFDEGWGSAARNGAAVGGSILPASHLALASDAALDMRKGHDRCGRHAFSSSQSCFSRGAEMNNSAAAMR